MVLRDDKLLPHYSTEGRVLLPLFPMAVLCLLPLFLMEQSSLDSHLKGLTLWLLTPALDHETEPLFTLIGDTYSRLLPKGATPLWTALLLTEISKFQVGLWSQLWRSC